MLLDAAPLSDGFLLSGWTLTGGDYDFWILRIASDGQLLWERRFGGGGADQAWSVSVGADGYLVVGGTTSFGAGASDVWAMKLDTSGNVLWSRTSGTPGDDAPPGAFEEYVARGLVDPAGGWMIAGITNGAGQGATDLFLARLDPATGDVLWAYTYGDSEEETLWSFQSTEAGDGFFLPGNTVNPSTLEGDLWVVRVDTSGALQWQHIFGLPGVWDEALNGTAAGGDLLVASYMETTSQDWSATLLRITGTGQIQWARTYKTGHLDWTNAVTPLPDGRIAWVGVTTDTTTWDQDLFSGVMAPSGDLPSCGAVGSFSPSVATTGAQRSGLSFTTTSP